MKCEISLVKRYHKPRYNLVINNTYHIKIPKKTWYRLYKMIENSKQPYLVEQSFNITQIGMDEYLEDYLEHLRKHI